MILRGASARGRGRLRASLLVVLVALAVAAFAIPSVADFFLLEIPDGEQAIVVTIGVVAGGIALIAAARNEERLAALATRLVPRSRRAPS